MWETSAVRSMEVWHRKSIAAKVKCFKLYVYVITILTHAIRLVQFEFLLTHHFASASLSLRYQCGRGFGILILFTATRALRSSQSEWLINKWGNTSNGAIVDRSKRVLSKSPSLSQFAFVALEANADKSRPMQRITMPMPIAYIYIVWRFLFSSNN